MGSGPAWPTYKADGRHALLTHSHPILASPGTDVPGKISLREFLSRDRAGAKPS